MKQHVTRVLDSIARGDPRASEALLPLVYEELRKLAGARLAHESSRESLQATGLVHEAYLRLIGSVPDVHAGWDGRGHFFAAAAEAMRRILVDRARARRALKRGGADARSIPLDSGIMIVNEAPDGLLALDDALEQLEAAYPQQAELVKLRFYAGLSMPEAADVLGFSLSKTERQWSFARAWLFSRLGDEEP